MENQLTHGLLAGAMMAMVNPLLGLGPISWSTFLAGMTAMLLSADSGHGLNPHGTPLGNSIGAGLGMMYVAGAVAYLAWAFAGLDPLIAATGAAAFSVGIAAMLLARLLTGGTVFTLPRNLRPGTWVRGIDPAYDRPWGVWGRLDIGGWRIRESWLNVAALTVGLAALWVF